MENCLIENIYDTILSVCCEEDSNECLSFGLQCMLENSIGDLLNVDSFGNFGKDEKLYTGTKAQAIAEFNKGIKNLKKFEQKWEVEDVISMVNLLYIFQYGDTVVTIIKLASWDNLEQEWEGVSQLIEQGEITGSLSENIKSEPLLYS